jgi:hypothetical protein
MNDWDFSITGLMLHFDTLIAAHALKQLQRYDESEGTVEVSEVNIIPTAQKEA